MSKSRNWMPLSFEAQKRFDKHIREKQAEVLGLTYEHYVTLVNGNKMTWRKWIDSDKRDYFYEIQSYEWVGLSCTILK